MKKIEIFVGSDSAFEKIVPKSARNLSEMAAKLDDGNKKMDVFVNIPGQPEPKLKKKKKPRVQDFVIHADEYCSVQEHVIINFINFIFQMSITNMYIQNPPKNIREQIYRTFDKSIIHETQQPYLEVSKEMIQTFNSQYSERVIGQERAKKRRRLMAALLILVIVAALLALGYAAFNFIGVKKLDEGTDRMSEIAEAIRVGANAFITYEYKIIGIVVVIIAIIFAAIFSVQYGKFSWEPSVCFIIGVVMM